MTMARYSGVVQDQAGNIIPNAKIEVRRETPGAPLAALKDGPDGLVPLTNPFNANGDGTFFFHVVGGFYKIRAYTGASSSPTFEQIIRYEGIGELQGYDLDAVLIGKRQQVRVATTANITISTALNNGDSIDGVTLATNDLVLVKNQTSKAENGVYVVGVSPARSAEFDTYNEHAGAMVAVVEGTAGAGSVWFCTANSGGTLGTTAIDFTELAATAGPPGADGEQGPPGPATIAIGAVTTLAAGEDATVTNSGDDENVILDFGIPEGADGPPGGVASIVAGENITVDDTDPANPIVSATGGSVDESADYDWTGQHTFTKALEVNPATGTMDQGFAIAQEPSGTSTASAYHAYNSIAVDNDDADTDGLTGANIAFSVTHNFGGSNTKGARIGNYTRVNLTAPTNSSNLAKEYVGVSGYCVALSDDGGTDLTTGARGSIFGANFVASVAPSIPNLFGVIGGEVNILLRTGSSAQRKIGWQIVAGADDAVQGATWDAALSISSQTGAVGWKDGIVFGNANGQFPMNSNGTILRATSGNATRGIDFNSVTFSGTAFRSPGFSVGSTGNINVGSSGSTNGTISFANATSGSVSFTPVSGALGSSVLSLPAKTGTLVVAADIRERLTANRTYYVRTDGSDSNTGLANTAGGAFLTKQKAADVIVGTLDLAGYAVEVQIADGTYTGAVTFSGPWTGGGTVTFRGNNSTPGNVIISTTNLNCFTNNGVLPGALNIRDMELRTTTSGSGINNAGTGLINFQNVNFGACATAHLAANAKGSKIQATGNYAINGGAGYHMLSLRGEIEISARTVTLTGTPAFSAAFAYAARLGYIGAEANTFSGSATGSRFNASANAVIYTGGGGANYFPGNAAGTGTNSGASPYGLYI